MDQDKKDVMAQARNRLDAIADEFNAAAKPPVNKVIEKSKKKQMDENKKLVITITGKPNTAKGFLAAKIAAVMRHLGQGEVTLISNDHIDPGDQELFTARTNLLLAFLERQPAAVAEYCLPTDHRLRELKAFTADQPVEIELLHRLKQIPIHPRLETRGDLLWEKNQMKTMIGLLASAVKHPETLTEAQKQDLLKRAEELTK